MVGSINAPDTGNTYDAFLAAAKAFTGTPVRILPPDMLRSIVNDPSLIRKPITARSLEEYMESPLLPQPAILVHLEVGPVVVDPVVMDPAQPKSEAPA